MVAQLGGRKFMAVLTAIVISLGAVWFKGDVPPGLADMLKWSLGLFVVGNLGAKFAYGRSGSECDDNEPAPAAPVDTTGVTNALNDLQTHMLSLQAHADTQAEAEANTQQAVMAVAQMLKVICQKVNISV